MAEIYLLPFNENQQQEYIHQFAAKNLNLNIGWTADRYRAALQLPRFQGLKPFLAEPLLLLMALTILPRMDERSTTIGTLRLDPLAPAGAQFGPALGLAPPMLSLAPPVLNLVPLALHLALLAPNELALHLAPLSLHLAPPSRHLFLVPPALNLASTPLNFYLKA